MFGPYLDNTKPPITLNSINPAAADQSKEMFMFNGISITQGPNYMLAKTLQNWRAMVAREDNKCRVSVNMAPMSSTESVMHVASVARAVRGMKMCPPITCYEPITAMGMMGLLVIYDLCSSTSQANPAVVLRNPYDIFASLGVHGGFWRAPFSNESIGKSAYVLDLVGIA